MPANDTYKIQVNGFTFFFTATDLAQADMEAITPADYHVIRDNQSASAHVLASDPLTKTFTIATGSETFSVVIKDALDQQLEQMGFGAATGKQVKEIKAPMPGLVLEINVTDGQTVKESDRLFILEAMKMENSILIQADATIKQVLVKPGQAVEKGQVLITLE